MSAEFDSDLRRRLQGLGSEVGLAGVPGPAAARARGRRRARNQAVGAVLGAAVLVGGAVIAVAQPTLRTAPDPADQPSESVSPPVATPTPSPSPTDATLPDSVLLTVADIEPDGEPIGWAETDPPAQGWPCVPPVPDSGRALQRHFENPEGGRIQQVVEPTGTVEQAEARFAEVHGELITCVGDGKAAGDNFRLDQVWSVTGVGDEALLVRYWAPLREQPPLEGQLLLVSVSIARTGNAVTTVARGGAAMDANLPDTTDDAEAAVTRLCAETGGACVTDPDQEQVYPEPTGDVPGWLTVAEVAEVMGVDRISAASEVVVAPDGSFGFVCFQTDARASGATSIESRTYHDPFDPGGVGVDEFIARFTTAAEARAYYDTLAAEGDACSAEPALSVQNTGTITGDITGMTWRATAADSEVAFVYGLVVNGDQVAFVNVNLDSPSDDDIETLLALAGERLSEVTAGQ
ncbi:MAG TPA: hypothetical protein VFR13_11830 [Jiangellaceae bacterium]|nr:hypothetical protein [Jiangellaceae bacterium]